MGVTPGSLWVHQLEIESEREGGNDPWAHLRSFVLITSHPSRCTV